MPIAAAPTLDRYAELKLIARGGMSEVWRGWDVKLGREVAIKLLDERFAEQPGFARRLEREARTAAAIGGHPNVVTIYDVGEWAGRPYIVMEFARGGSVAERMRAGRPDLSIALTWLEHAADALDHAHHAGIVHRDIKPGNFLLDDRDNVLVADFGIAQVADESLTQLTRTGELLGTPGYIAPEQAEGRGATAASDRYSFAVVAFELLTGRRPFARPTAMAEVLAHVQDAPPAASSLEPSLAPEVDEVLERALAKQPGRRYDSATQLVRALRAAVGLPAHEPTALLAGALPATTRRLSRPATPRGSRVHSSTLAVRMPTRVREAGERYGWRSLGLLAGVVLLLLTSAALAAMAPDGREGPLPVVPPTERSAGEQVVSSADDPPATENRGQEGAGKAKGNGKGKGQGKDKGNGKEQGAGAPSAREAIELNDRAWSLMQQGRYEDARPLLERALPSLSGVLPHEAYAEYNLGKTLLELGECSGVRDHLERSRELQGERAEITAALEQHDRQCG